MKRYNCHELSLPLGFPVDPEVKKIIEISFSLNFPTFRELDFFEVSISLNVIKLTFFF